MEILDSRFHVNDKNNYIRMTKRGTGFPFSREWQQTTIPAEIEINITNKILDSHFHGNDKIKAFTQEWQKEELDSRFHGNDKII